MLIRGTDPNNEHAQQDQQGISSKAEQQEDLNPDNRPSFIRIQQDCYFCPTFQTKKVVKKKSIADWQYPNIIK